MRKRVVNNHPRFIAEVHFLISDGVFTTRIQFVLANEPALARVPTRTVLNSSFQNRDAHRTENRHLRLWSGLAALSWFSWPLMISKFLHGQWMHPQSFFIGSAVREELLRSGLSQLQPTVVENKSPSLAVRLDEI